MYHYSSFVGNVFRYLVSESDVNAWQTAVLSANRERITPLSGRDHPSIEVWN